MKKMAIVLALLVFCTACQKIDNQAAARGVYVYSLSADRGKILDSRWEALSAKDSQSQLNETLKLLSRPAGQNAAFVPGVKVLSSTLVGVSLQLDLSAAFTAKISGLTLTKHMAAAVMSLCSLPFVRNVRIHVEGNKIPSVGDVYLSASDFITGELGVLASEYAVRLYFPDVRNSKLLTEQRSMVIDGGDVADAVVGALAAGSQQYSSDVNILKPSQVVKVSEDENGLCTIDLSAKFWDSLPDSAAGQILPVYAIIDSVAEAMDVTGVVFLKDGVAMTALTHLDLSEPLRWESQDSVSKMIADAG